MTVKEKLKILLKKEIYKYVNIFDKHILTKNNKKIGRKKLYTNNQCLDILLNIIFEGSTFRNTCKTLKNNHAYTSVFKRINLWIFNNVFKDMYINLSVNYKTKNEIDRIFIDSTDILNLNGTKEFTDYSYKFKSKRAAKLTLTCDKNKVPLSYDVHKSSVKDSTILEKLVDKHEIYNKNKIYLCADKGYYTKKVTRQMYINKGITLVVPKKNYNKKNKILKTKWYKRPKVRHTQEMKDMLKQRVKIEHVNNRIHRSFKRVHNLYEKQIVKYRAFVEIALSGLILEKI